MIAFAVLQATLPSRKSTEHQQIDYFGAAVLAAALASIVLACTWGGTTYPPSPLHGLYKDRRAIVRWQRGPKQFRFNRFHAFTGSS